MLRKAGYETQLVMMTRVLASADAVNGELHLRMKRLNIEHCGLTVWHPEGEAEPSCSALPTTGTGNGSDPEQSAAKRREEFAAVDAPVTGAKHGGGGGDIRPGRGDAPAAASIPTVSITTGNGTDHPAATAPTDDGLDIPPYLRREPKAVSS